MASPEVRAIVYRHAKRSSLRLGYSKFCEESGGKVKYPTQGAALQAAAKLQKLEGARINRAYACEQINGRKPHWHLTRSELRFIRWIGEPEQVGAVTVHCGPAASLPKTQIAVKCGPAANLPNRRQWEEARSVQRGWEEVHQRQWRGEPQKVIIGRQLLTVHCGPAAPAPERRRV